MALIFAAAVSYTLLAASAADAANRVYDTPDACSDIWTRVQTGKFKADRSLDDYERFLGSDFFDTLAQLKSDQVWLDAGSGQSVAITDYLEQFPNGGKTIGVTIQPIVDPVRVYAWAIQARRHRQFVQKDFLKIPETELGHPRVISDFLGVFSYAPQPDQVLQKYINLLAPEGSIYLHFDPKLSTVLASNDEVISLARWMQSIEGLQVEAMHINTYKITRLPSASRTPRVIRVPRLILDQIEDGTPPKRFFRAE